MPDGKQLTCYIYLYVLIHKGIMSDTTHQLFNHIKISLLLIIKIKPKFRVFYGKIYHFIQIQCFYDKTAKIDQILVRFDKIN